MANEKNQRKWSAKVGAGQYTLEEKRNTDFTALRDEMTADGITYSEWQNLMRAKGLNDSQINDVWAGRGMSASAVNPLTDPSATPAEVARYKAELTPEMQAQFERTQAAQQLQAKNQPLLDGYGTTMGMTWAGNGQARADQLTNNQAQTAYDTQYADRSQALATQMSQMGQYAYGQDLGALNTYTGQLQGISQQNNAYLGGLGQQYQALSTPLQSTTQWQGDLTSQAAQAYADPAAVQAQMQGLSMLQGSAGGALNVNYAGLDPNAYANVNSAMNSLQGGVNGDWDVNYGQLDPAAYANVNASMEGLRGAGEGRLNVNYNALNAASTNAVNGNIQRLSETGQGAMDFSLSDADPAAYAMLMAAGGDARDVYYGKQDIQRDSEALGHQRKALGDLYGIAGGSNDVAVGQLDPEAYAAQKSALSQYGALTNPEVTDAERFIYEKERLGAEQSERANREANMASLRQRGMGGSGMELTNTALANQQTSQNRLLGDLGANAAAVARSMQALQGYGALSTDMVNSSNQLASANMDRRFAGLSGYGAQANIMADDAFDVNKVNQATRMQGLGLTADINDSLLSMGVDVSKANQSTRLQGMTNAGALANQDLQQRAGVAMNNSNMQLQGYQSLGAVANQSLGQQAAVATNNMDRRYSSANSLGNMANQSLGQQAQVATANSDRQLSAQNAYTTQAGNARNSSFNEAFSRGSAADQTAQYNRTTSLDVSMFNDKFNQQERDSSWGRSTDLVNANLATGAQNAGLAGNQFNASTGVTATNWDRYGQTVAAQDNANTRLYNGQSNQTVRQQDLINQTRSDNSDMLSQYGGYIGQQMTANGGTAAATDGFWTAKAGSEAASSATQAAIAQAEAGKETSLLWGAVSW